MMFASPGLHGRDRRGQHPIVVAKPARQLADPAAKNVLVIERIMPQQSQVHEHREYAVRRRAFQVQRLGDLGAGARTIAVEKGQRLETTLERLQSLTRGLGRHGNGIFIAVT